MSDIQTAAPALALATDRITVDGHVCSVVDRGQGAPVVALHGLGSIASEIAAPLLPLAARHRLFVPDRPGYGGSASIAADPLPPEAQARWLRGVLRHAGVRRPIIVAHSIAAAVALCFAMDFPDDVAGLVFLAPFCRPTRPRSWPLLRLALLPLVGGAIRRTLYRPITRLFSPSLMQSAFAPNPVPPYLAALPVPDLVTPEALPTMGAELNGFNATMMRRCFGLRGLHVPSVVLAGEADRTAPPERHARWLAKRLPDASFRQLQGVGHMVQHVRPDAVIDAVAQLERAA
jgi:pimeloyl-ACP methyl ester carboxylesterase